MKNTFRVFNFIVSMLVFYLLRPYFSYISDLIESILLKNGFNTVVFFLLLGSVQALTRFIYLKPWRVKKIMSYNITGFSLGDKSLFYIVPFLLYILPLIISLFNDFQVDDVLLRITVFLVTITLFGALLRFSKCNTIASFTEKGVLVHGYDVRLDLPLINFYFNRYFYFNPSGLSLYELPVIL
ncbi:hypothetical protein, partial [Alkaliphilus pronyensis]|uniref:hypothetical protein n=1 Tax=Alkaliphilus pronyensis TaxID=1482732 RepID=UPI001A9B923F